MPLAGGQAALILFAPADGAGDLRKEVIHVSLSLVRGIVADVDHLERSSVEAARLSFAP